MLIMIFVWALLLPPAKAATIWTQQPDEYHWYKSGTTNKYLSTSFVDIPTNYIKQDGIYIKCTSTGGANKYWQQGYDCYGKQIAPQPPIVTYCDAKFVCHENWGWIVDLTQLKADGCNHVKITKELALFYSGQRATSSGIVCPTWTN